MHYNLTIYWALSLSFAFNILFNSLVHQVYIYTTAEGANHCLWSFGC